MAGDDLILKLDGSGPNTMIEYVYRDGGNYKQTGFAVLEGQITETQIATLKASFSDGMFFIPGQVGLDGLQSGEWDDDIDHVWHTIEAVEHTNKPAGGTSVAALMKSWPDNTEGWDLAAATPSMSY